MKRLLDRSAGLCLRWAAALTPRPREEWARAMSAEAQALPAGGERLRFAVGCLSFALRTWARTRQGLVSIGRGAIAGGLWAMSAIGVYIATGLDAAPSFTLLAACCTYSIGGAAALFSLDALRRFSIFAGACAALAFVLARSNLTALSNYYAAVAIEAAVLMGALLLAANVLIAIGNKGERDA